MKRLVAKITEASAADYDADDRGQVLGVGSHHGGNASIYMAHKVMKLRRDQQLAATEISSNIFQGCILFVNGITDPPVDELRRLIRIHGGECLAYRAVKISHFVCDYFTDAQLKSQYAKIKLNATQKVHNVTVAWLLESIKQEQRLDENFFAPAGLGWTHGADIRKLMGSSAQAEGSSNAPSIHDIEASSSSSTSSGPASASRGFSKADAGPSAHLALPVESAMTAGIGSSREQRGGAVQLLSNELGFEVELTASQEDFVGSVPEEMRPELLDQFAALNKEMLLSRYSKHSGSNDPEQRSSNNSNTNSNTVNNGSSSSSKSTAVSKVVDSGTDAAANSAVQRWRRESVEEVVNTVHFHQGQRCGSYAVHRNMLHYVRELIVAGAFASDPAVEVVEAEADQPCSVHAVRQVLCDYGLWLIHASQYQQVGRDALLCFSCGLDCYTLLSASFYIIRCSGWLQL